MITILVALAIEPKLPQTNFFPVLEPPSRGSATSSSASSQPSRDCCGTTTTLSPGCQI